ncbi:MAG: anti-sigma factor [Hyphomicrobiales bacterium]|nr:anti-sigma factor [Hyphomicrobiales bacterium]
MMSGPYGAADLHAYLDGEMPPEDHAAFNQWLAANPAMGRLLSEFEADRQKLHEALDAAAAGPAPKRIERALAGGRRQHSTWIRQVAAALLIFAAGVAAGWVVSDYAGPGASAVAGDPATAERALTAHLVYVSEVLHPVEVAADQKAHLVKWLSKRMGHRLTAPDLAAAGMHLIGGRLLPGETAAAAQLMYEDASGKRVTLYVGANPQNRQTAFRLAARGSVRSFYWLDGPFGYALAGDLEEDRLLELARMVYQATISPAAQ